MFFVTFSKLMNCSGQPFPHTKWIEKCQNVLCDIQQNDELFWTAIPAHKMDRKMSEHSLWCSAKLAIPTHKTEKNVRMFFVMFSKMINCSGQPFPHTEQREKCQNILCDVQQNDELFWTALPAHKTERKMSECSL